MNTQELDKIFRDLKVDFNKPISLPVIIELMEEYGKRLKPLPDTEGVDWDKLEKEFMKENGGKSANDIETIAAYYNWISEWFKQKLSGKHIGDGWIEVKDRTPELIEGKDYSENVFAIEDGHIRIMNYNYVNEEDGGYLWANCYGDIAGDGELDDDYSVTHWMPLPKSPTNH